MADRAEHVDPGDHVVGDNGGLRRGSDSDLQLLTEKTLHDDMSEEPPGTRVEDQSVSRNPKHAEPGMASIKSEFIDLNHKPRLDEDYIPKPPTKALPNSTTSDASNNQDGGNGEEPPQKKRKLKGRNKKRPVEKCGPSSERVCPAVIREQECSWGTRCKFSHDVAKFMETKLPDLGDKCYVFEKYGKCSYGISCRYGSRHISETFTNIVNEEKWVESQKKMTVKNALDKQTQNLLRKKKYDFSRGDKFFKQNKQNICQSNNSDHDSQRASKFADSQKSLVTGADGGEQRMQTDLSNSDQSGSRLSETKVDSVVHKIAAGALQEKPTPSLISSELSGVGKSLGGDEASGETAQLKVTGQCLGVLTDEDVITLRPQEKKKISFSDKLYLAPLTTVGNLPFRRVCKRLGADVTCGEMAMTNNLLQGQQSEWALVKRHESEDLFGVQLCGSFPDSMTRCAQLLTECAEVDFIDINCGCPIDLVFKRGEGSALMGRTQKFEQIVHGMKSVMGDIPLTVKMRTGIYEDKSTAHTLAPRLRDWGVSLVTIHGRSREQRYTRLADWDYIGKCAEAASPMPVFGNGDVMSFEDANLHKQQTGTAGVMIARGALIKPWVFTEIKEQRHWDISSGERLDLLKDFVSYGLEHWGSDTQGVGTTRRFLLEWLSFLHRYIPVGVLERVPQKINEKPPHYFGRNDLETLMASSYCGDWVKISEMLLGPVPDGFTFLPKHKANAYK